MGSISVDDFLASPSPEKEKKTAGSISVDDFLTTSETESDREDEPLPVIDKGKSLKVDDIVNTQSYVDTIRDYMVDRKGKHYLEKDAEEVVDDFIGHMRYFNTNEMFTIDEVRYVSKSDDDAKRMAGKAYQIYDKLGNVFVNDGLGGAVSGVADYIGAVMSSPSTYLGLGVGKFLASGGSKLGVKAVKEMAKKASREAIEKQAKKAGSGKGKLSDFRRVAREAEDDIIRKGVRARSMANIKATGTADALVAVGQDYSLQSDVMMETGAQNDYSILQTGLSALGSGLGTGLSIYSVPKLTGASERGLSGDIANKIKKANAVKKAEIKSEKELEKLNKRYLKRVRDQAKKLKVKDVQALSITESKKATREKFNKLAAENKKLLTQQKTELGKLYTKNKNIELQKKKIGRELTDKKKAELQSLRVQAKKLELDRRRTFRKQQEITDDKAKFLRLKPGTDYRGFQAMVARGYDIDEPALGADVLSFIFGKSDDSPLGDDIITMAEEAGAKFRPNMNNAQKYARAFQYLDEKTLQEVSQLTKEKFGVYLGDALDTLNFSTNLGYRVAKSASEAGKDLAVFQRGQNEIDDALIEGTEKLLDEQGKVGRFGKKALQKSGAIGYAQNVWKRLLVSAPQTTAANVFGFGQYYLANSAAELLQGTAFALTGDMQKAKALFQLQGTKIRNLLDPYSTLDNYEALLSTDDELSRFLRETISGGVERAVKRFDLEKYGKGVSRVERATNLAQKISAVNLQDSLTKSQMFMTSIDKYTRLLKGKTFQDVLESGNLVDLDQEVLDRAMGDTLKSVFAEDYTVSKSLGGFAGAMAQAVEKASNTPGIGFVLPFGRFMNNVMATAYQWSPLGAIEGATALMRGRSTKLDFIEALSKSTVGLTAIAYAMDFQDAQQERGYAWNEMETGTGEVANITNTFPLSLLMIAGRVGSKMRKGEQVDRDLASEFGKQLAIGQAATDLEFGNDITRLLVLAFNNDQEFKGTLPTILEGVSYTGGNIVAGATRPLDVLNKLTGYVVSDVGGLDITPTVDKRLARGSGEKFTLNATKYVDNILEGIASVVKGEPVLLGQEKRVAYREGDLVDPSPYRTMTGQKLKQPRTFANIVFGMVDKPEWKTGMYTGVPEYDRFANKVLAPLIEKEAEFLLKDRTFVKADGDTKRAKVNAMLRRVKGRVNKYLTEVPKSKEGLDYRRKKLDSADKLALKRAKKIVGIESGVDVRDLTDREITALESAIKMLRYYDKQ